LLWHLGPFAAELLTVSFGNYKNGKAHPVAGGGAASLKNEIRAIEMASISPGTSPGYRKTRELPAAGGKKKSTDINFSPSRVFKRTSKRKKLAEWLETTIDGFVCQSILGVLLIGEKGGEGEEEWEEGEEKERV
jgi:hypothetical protein